MMMSTTVFAEDTNSSEDYVVTYSAEEITDIDELIELALEQKAAQPMMFSMEEEDTLVATQVLETRVYSDNHKENDYLVSTLALSYPHTDLIEATSGTYVAGIMQFAFTHSLVNAVDHISARYNRAKIMQKNSSTSTVAIKLWWEYQYDIAANPTYASKTVTNNASLNTWYTWNINSAPKKLHVYYGGLSAGADFVVSGYGTSSIQADWSVPQYGCE